MHSNSQLLLFTFQGSGVHITSNPNFIITKFDHLLLVNMYLPHSSSSSNFENVAVILDSVVNLCLSVDHSNIILGGDLNCNVCIESPLANLINQSLALLQIKVQFDYIDDSNRKSSLFVSHHVMLSL